MTRRRSLLFTLLIVAVTLSTLVAAMGPDPGQAARRDRRHARTEVVRGLGVPDGRYPFVAAIGVADASGNLKRQFCGGSLIAPSYVLTAAHCVVGAKPESIAVVVGQTAFGSGQGESRTLAAIMVHPAFNQRNLSSDVAVLQLNAPILSITPAAVIGAGDGSLDVPGSSLTVVGWGNTARSSLHHASVRFPDQLKEGTIAVVSDASCAKQWRKVRFGKKFSPSLLLCTTARRFGSGDSGSPLFSAAGGTFVQVSLVSGGFIGAKKVSDFGPQLSEPSIASFIDSSIGA